MRRTLVSSCAVLGLFAGLVLLGAGGPPLPVRAAQAEGPNDRGVGAATARLHDRRGDEVGEVRFLRAGDGLRVKAELEGLDLEPGFYGLHLHERGECDADAEAGAFATAGGHYAPDEADHGEHAGDFPPLLVTSGGQGRLSFDTDRLEPGDLVSGEGTAVILHTERDNLAHIPDRYRSTAQQEPGPDAQTKSTGDAGDRAACGVVRAEKASAGPR